MDFIRMELEMFRTDAFDVKITCVRTDRKEVWIFPPTTS